MKKHSFELWYEPDEYENPDGFCEDFCNIQIKMDDGKKYALNVWSYAYFHEVLIEEKLEGGGESPVYILPPDLFVRTLSRETIKQAIDKLLSEEGMCDSWRILD